MLGFDTAALPSRLLARLLDVSLQMVALAVFVTGLVFLSGAGVPDMALVIAASFVVPLLLFGYPVICEALWRGRTLGKAVLGLRVVTVEGAPVRFRHALLRGAADLVDLYGLGVLLVAPGAVGAVAIAASKRNQRLGDMVAGTVVVRERSGAARTTPAAFAVPLGWEGYAATVDVSGLATRDYQAVRSYLLRAPGLRADARQQVSTELARSVASAIHHTPPPGVAPELLLAVVAANVQARSGGRPVAVSTSMPEPFVAGGWGAVPSWPTAAAHETGGVTVPPTPPAAEPPAPSTGGFAAPS